MPWPVSRGTGTTWGGWGREQRKFIMQLALQKDYCDNGGADRKETRWRAVACPPGVGWNTTKDGTQVGLCGVKLWRWI